MLLIEYGVHLFIASLTLRICAQEYREADGEVMCDQYDVDMQNTNLKPVGYYCYWQSFSSGSNLLSIC